MIIFLRVPQICRHIKSPAIHKIGRLQPFLCRLQYIGFQFFRSFIIQFWQRLITPPAFVGTVIRPCLLILKMKIIPVRTVRRKIRPLCIAFRFFVDSFPVQPLMKRSAVIKHTVQNHLHAPVMNFLYKICKPGVASLQIFLIHYPLLIDARLPVIFSTVRQRSSPVFCDQSQMRINVIIILGIIFMIGRRYKDRIQIQHFHSQLLQIIKLLPYALQISAIKILHVTYFRQLIPVCHPVHIPVQIPVFPVFHIVRWISIAETVRINLIHHRTFRPMGRVKVRNQAKRIGFLRMIRDSQFVKIKFLFP